MFDFNHNSVILERDIGEAQNNSACFKIQYNENYPDRITI